MRRKPVGVRTLMDTVCTAVPDDCGLFYWGSYMYTVKVNMKIFNSHHSVFGTQFFLGNVDIFFDPKIRQLCSQGCRHSKEQNKIAVYTPTKKHCGADVQCVTPAENQPVFGREMIHVDIGVSSV